MNSKFALVRRELESARERLDGTEELEVAVASVLDHIIQTVLKIEHMQAPSSVVPFPVQENNRRS